MTGIWLTPNVSIASTRRNSTSSSSEFIKVLSEEVGVTKTPTVFLNGARFEGLDELRLLVRGTTSPAAPAWDYLLVENFELDFEGSPSSGMSDAPLLLLNCGNPKEVHATVGTEDELSAEVRNLSRTSQTRVWLSALPFHGGSVAIRLNSRHEILPPASGGRRAVCQRGRGGDSA